MGPPVVKFLYARIIAGLFYSISVRFASIFFAKPKRKAGLRRLRRLFPRHKLSQAVAGNSELCGDGAFPAAPGIARHPNRARVGAAICRPLTRANVPPPAGQAWLSPRRGEPSGFRRRPPFSRRGDLRSPAVMRQGRFYSVGAGVPDSPSPAPRSAERAAKLCHCEA